jgi:RNA ligase (TIGR02306 family)
MSSLIVEVCKVEKSEKHPNADRLSLVIVKGWQCITGLDQYKEGELVVFVPPDSIIPQNIIDELNLEYLKNGGRVGSTKLRGYISQGLILTLPKGKNYKEGDDVAKDLGITKWEPPAPNYQQQVSGNKKSTRQNLNPHFDKYSDLENIKNYNNVFQEGDKVYISEKLHGTSWRAGNLPVVNKGFKQRVKNLIHKLIGKYNGYEFVYGSRNVQLSYTSHKGWYGDDVYGKIAEMYDMKNIVPKDYAVYGEVVGKGIQDLEYGLDHHDLYVYDIKFNGKYLPYEDMKVFCDDRGLKIVPPLYIGEWNENLIEQYTNGKSIIAPNQIREGCVIKDRNESIHPRVGRKVLKSISFDYLTRKDATEFH